MVFSSTLFLFLFLPIMLAIYYVTGVRFKNYVLLLGSLIFYSWGEPRYILLMLLSILVNFSIGIVMNLVTEKVSRRLILVVGIIFNLSMLIAFKYLNFIAEICYSLFHISFNLPDIVLPIGISFYTFQILSYLIDVYRRNTQVQRNVLNLGLYISLFPQLIAGPIVRYQDVERQIQKRNVTTESFGEGIRLFMAGFSKKILLADQLAPLANLAFSSQPPSFILAWVGVICYTLQIFFDFSGYSDMARGLGRMFGFDFTINFDLPYISQSITEFWRRWHISLSTWFRDYVYIPLGGSRCSARRASVNLLIVFILTGIWHGASWNFVIWGLYYGILLVLEKNLLKKYLDKAVPILRHIYTLLIVLVGWVVFRADTLTQAWAYIKSLFCFSLENGRLAISYLTLEKGFFIICGILLSTSLTQKLNARLPLSIQNFSLYFIFLLSILYMIGSGFSPFLYFRF